MAKKENKKEKNKKKKLGCFVAGCSVFIFLFILIVGVCAYALLYVPTADSAYEKLKTDESLAVNKYDKGVTVYSEGVMQAINEIALVSDADYVINEIVEFKTAGEVGEDDYVYGVLIYTDEISSSFNIMNDYLKFLTNSSTEDASKLEHHFSPRGKVIFVGNVNAEIVFRLKSCLY